MILPRFLSRQLAPALVLGAALLTFAPSPRAHAEGAPVVLTTDLLDKVAAFNKAASSDAAAKADMAAMSKDEALGASIMSGADVDQTFTSKYPKATAAFKSAGITPSEYFRTVFAMMPAAMAAEMGTPADDKTPQANIDFAKANKAKITEVMSSMPQ